MKLYQEELMEHYRNSPFRKRIEVADFDTGQYNPSCGDAVSMQGIIQDGVFAALAFQGKGCVISQATASILCQYALQKPVAILAAMQADELMQLIKIPLGPTRLQCALLSLHALQEGIKQYKKDTAHVTSC